MIRVTVARNAKDGLIQSFRVEGHAEYDVPGKDIVCAGVSAVAVGAVNAIEALTGAKLKVKTKHGYLHAVVPKIDRTDASEKVQLLLESMVVSLRTIEQSYGAYIAMQEDGL
jgi:uncharacterized protein YsxB (DUF464 family)